ncbi:MAG: isoprenylcysteine carboxylmethyltransferase family protein [Clostridia bacterium]|nr:isoprenylcysteine carboxylmethyltransferase family protein [Clostridia bacterium]
MTKGLFFKAIAKFLIGFVIVAAILFLSAGTLRWPNAWLFLGLLFIPMFIAGIVMMLLDPSLLEKRLNAKETEGEQRTVIALSALMFLAAFVLAGLNFRFKWIELPNWIVFLAAAVFLLAYLMYAEVLRENTYLARTIGVSEGQKVISTGLYGVVRHPMYLATLFLFPAMGLVLGSPISFLILLLYIPLIVKRIKNEEKVLEAELEGYREYETRIKYRLIPFIW